MEQKQSLNWVDAMKGLAICGVVCVHSGGGSLPSTLGLIGANGSKCVQLFFLISAFLAYISLDHYFKDRTVAISLSSTKNWWIRKFLRLIPIYYVALVVYTPIAPHINGWLGSEGHVTIKNFITHLFFVHGFVPHYVNSIIGVEWYLGVLAIFYVVVPFIYKYVNSFERAFALFAIATVGGSYLNDFGYARVPQVTEQADAQIYSSYFGTHWFFTQLPTLALGIMLYFIIKSDALAQLKQKKVLSVALFGYSGFMLLAQMYGYNAVYRTSIYTMFGLWFAGILLSQVLWSYRIFDNRLFRTLGKYSYPIYLIHYFLIVCYGKIPFSTGNSNLDFVLRYVVVLGVSLALSYPIDRLFDKPIFRKLCSVLHV